MIRQKSIFNAIVLVFVCSLALLACEKTTFNTKPTLTFLSVRSNDLVQGNLLDIRLRVLDKEGDISDTLYITAGTRRCPNNTVNLFYKVPDVPQKSDLNAEIAIRFLIGIIGEFPVYNLNLCPGVDTVNFQFWIKDIKGNISDTIGTSEPILIRNS